LSFGSQEWANDQLKYAIKELKDSHSKSEFCWAQTLRLALIVKERLLDYGWVWQAKIIDFWIHKYAGRRIPR
jgi:hypothetical protein